MSEQKQATAERPRRGGWIVTYPMRIRFYPLDPSPEDVKIDDIAHALSNIARFGGHTERHYSVAQHCVLMAKEVIKNAFDNELAKKVLLHDAHEAYIGDWQRLVKSAVWFKMRNPKDVFFEPIDVVEMRLDCAIEEAFGFVFQREHEKLVKLIDERMLATEKRDLFPLEGPWPGLEGVEPLLGRVDPWPNTTAKAEFLRLWWDLQ